MDYINIILTKKSMPMDIMDYEALESTSVNGVEVVANADDLALPWDATINVKYNMLVITGGVGCSGYGRAVARLPIDDRLPGAVNLSIQPDSEDDYDEAVRILDKYHWR